jgi:hypothetical protein
VKGSVLQMPCFTPTFGTVGWSHCSFQHLLSVEPPHLSAPAHQKTQEDSLMGNEYLLCYYSSDHNISIAILKSIHYIGCCDHPLIYTANNALSHIFPFHLQIAVIPQSL